MNVDAAVWSAVAASFAALSSFLTMRIQRRNLLESARPEIVIDLWGRSNRGEDDSACEVITFGSLRNIGKGPALHVTLNSSTMSGDRPTSVLSTTRYTIIGPGETQRLTGEIIVWWKNVKDQTGGKYLPITIVIWSWDSHGVRHETTYILFVTEHENMVAGSHEVAPGVALTTRTTESVPVWWLKLKGRLRKLTWWRK